MIAEILTLPWLLFRIDPGFNNEGAGMLLLHFSSFFSKNDFDTMIKFG